MAKKKTKAAAQFASGGDVRHCRHDRSGIFVLTGHAAGIAGRKQF
jgi:hypothetical protein